MNKSECRDSQLLKMLRINDNYLHSPNIIMLPLSHREFGGRSGGKKRNHEIKRPSSQHNPVIVSSFAAAAIACTRPSQDWAYQQPILDQGVAHETINPYLTPGYSGGRVSHCL